MEVVRKDNIAVSTKGYISEKAMYKNCPKTDMELLMTVVLHLHWT